MYNYQNNNMNPNYLQMELQKLQEAIMRMEQDMSRGYINPQDMNAQNQLYNMKNSYNQIRQQLDTMMRQQYTNQQYNNQSMVQQGYNPGSRFSQPMNYNPYQSAGMNQTQQVSTSNNSTVVGSRFDNVNYQMETAKPLEEGKSRRWAGETPEALGNRTVIEGRCVQKDLVLFTNNFDYKIVPAMTLTKNDMSDDEIKIVKETLKKRLQEKRKEISLRSLLELKDLLALEKEQTTEKDVFKACTLTIRWIADLLGHFQLMINKVVSVVANVPDNIVTNLDQSSVDFLLSCKDNVKLSFVDRIFMRIDRDLRRIINDATDSKLDREFTEVVMFSNDQKSEEQKNNFSKLELEMNMELKDGVVSVDESTTAKTYSVLSQILQTGPKSDFGYLYLQSKFDRYFYYIVHHNKKIYLIRK